MVLESGVSTKKRILFVDDDPKILHALARLLRHDHDRWDMTFVLGGAAAIVALQQGAFHAVVSDHCMPVVDGVAVLSAARQHSPSTVRIMLTASVIEDAAMGAYAVLAKPLDSVRLRNILQRALAGETAQA